MVFIGLLNGTLATLFFLVILEVVGLAGFPTACGISLAIGGVSCTLGSPMAGKACIAHLHAHAILDVISCLIGFFLLKNVK